MTKSPQRRRPGRIAIFASGNGTNAENIINYFRARPGVAEVVLIVCNKADAPVVGRARRLGVETCIIDRVMIGDEARMIAIMDHYAVDLIVLAGFLMMVPPFLIHKYSGRMINIHPSLLPKYGGKGMYGCHVHEAVVAAGEDISGITVHYVSEQYDEGEIIFQASVDVLPTDTPADLARRIAELEATHFPRVIHDIFFHNRPDAGGDY